MANVCVTTVWPAAFGDNVSESFVYGESGVHLWCAFHNNGRGSYLPVSEGPYGDTALLVLEAAAVAARERRCDRCRIERPHEIYSNERPTLLQCREVAPRLLEQRRRWLISTNGDGGKAADMERRAMEMQQQAADDERRRGIAKQLTMVEALRCKLREQLLIWEKSTARGDVTMNNAQLRNWISKVEGVDTSQATSTSALAKLMREWLEATPTASRGFSSELMAARQAALDTLDAGLARGASLQLTDAADVAQAYHKELMGDVRRWAEQDKTSARKSAIRRWNAKYVEEASSFAPCKRDRLGGFMPMPPKEYLSGNSDAGGLHRGWDNIQPPGGAGDGFITLNPGKILARHELEVLRDDGRALLSPKEPIVLEREAASGRPCLVEMSTDELWTSPTSTNCVLYTLFFAAGASAVQLGVSRDLLVERNPDTVSQSDMHNLVCRSAKSRALGALRFRNVRNVTWEILRRKHGILCFSVWLRGHPHHAAYNAGAGLLCIGPWVLVVEENDRLHLDLFALTLQRQYGLVLKDEPRGRLVCFDPRHAHAGALPYAGDLPVEASAVPSKSAARRAKADAAGSKRRRSRGGAKNRKRARIEKA